MSRTWKYDFFLAHAGADLSAAEQLYRFLFPDASVFLDSKTLLPGDDWDRELSLAQKESLITVVLVSSRSGEAYYQREEIAAAISMARENKQRHRVVPIYLDEFPQENTIVPYGLRIKHGLKISREGDLQKIAERLKALLAQLDKRQSPGHSEGAEKEGELPLQEKAGVNREVVTRTKPGEMIVRCARCGGTGTRDRDGRQPACSVCDGAGHVLVVGSPDTFTKCSFCDGDGTQDRDGREPVCPVCNGIGGFVIVPPTITCAACDGTGTRDRDGKPPICPACGGKGVRHAASLRKY